MWLCTDLRSSSEELVPAISSVDCGLTPCNKESMLLFSPNHHPHSCIYPKFSNFSTQAIYLWAGICNHSIEELSSYTWYSSKPPLWYWFIGLFQDQLKLKYPKGGDNLHGLMTEAVLAFEVHQGSRFRCLDSKVKRGCSDQALSSLIQDEPFRSLELILNTRPTSMIKLEHFCSNILLKIFRAREFATKLW